MSRFGAKRVFKEEWKEGGLRGRRESGRECRRPAGRVSFSRYLETESELWEQIRVNAEKTSNFTFSLWQMHRCWKMVERRCEWMREIYSYLFSDRTMAKQSDVSCWWNANRIHFFLLIPSKKNIGSVVFPTSHNSFWLESHNQFWSLIYQVTPFNSFVAREDFFLKATCTRCIQTLLEGYLPFYSWFAADHKSKMHFTFFRPHYLAFWRVCNSNLLTFCWLWATLMVFLEPKPSTVTETTDNCLTVSLWEAISVGLRRRNQMNALRKCCRTMIRQFLFHCNGLCGTHSAEMDFTMVYFVLKWQ